MRLKIPTIQIRTVVVVNSLQPPKTRPRFQICLRGKGRNDSKSADYVEVKVEQPGKYVAVGNVLD